MLINSLRMLGKALRLRAALPSNPGLHLEVKETFLAFALTLTLALALGWWGIGKFRRRKPETPAAE